MISKFEAIGIFASIAVMAVALFILRVENVYDTIGAAETVNQAAGVVVVDETGGQQAQAQAIADSIADTGTPSKLIIDDVKIGGGSKAEIGDTVTVHYTGRLINGQEFDSSHKRGTPFSFTLGEKKVIAGWDEGVVGMNVGGERILVIPPQLAYGSSAVGPIPANSTLIFAIELLAVEKSN